jgi:uncharacterized membrane protein YoaK (UPF0700 family)
MNLKSLINATKAHETIAIGILLSLLGGFLDAYTYTLEDGVFANAQTGNLVLLAVSILSNKTGEILKYLIPIIMFSAGIFISEDLKSFKKLDDVKRVKIVLFFEAVIILFIGWRGDQLSSFIVNSIVSFLAAIQVSTFNRIKNSPVATTMITGNLRSTMEQFHLFIKTKDRTHGHNAAAYLCIILFFAVGASLGAYTSNRYGNYAIFFCLVFLFLAYLVISLCAKKISGQKPR